MSMQVYQTILKPEDDQEVFTFPSYELEERIYVQEVYCTNPRCDCNEVTLVFYTIDENKRGDERLSELRYDLLTFEMKDIKMYSKRMSHQLFVQDFKPQIDGFRDV